METIFIIALLLVLITLILTTYNMLRYKKYYENARDAFIDIAKKYRKIVNDPYGTKENKSQIIDN